MIKHIHELTPKEISPNDVIEIGSAEFRVRYITYHGGSTSLHLQRKDEPISPFTQNDVVHLSIDNSVPILLNVVIDAE